MIRIDEIYYLMQGKDYLSDQRLIFEEMCVEVLRREKEQECGQIH